VKLCLSNHMSEIAFATEGKQDETHLSSDKKLFHCWHLVENDPVAWDLSFSVCLFHTMVHFLLCLYS